MTAIEIRIRTAIERAREQSSSIPDVERLFLSLKSDFPEIGISTGDSEGERACIGLMLMTLKMLMPECKAIMEAYAARQLVAATMCSYKIRLGTATGGVSLDIERIV